MINEVLAFDKRPSLTFATYLRAAEVSSRDSRSIECSSLFSVKNKAALVQNASASKIWLNTGKVHS